MNFKLLNCLNCEHHKYGNDIVYAVRQNCCVRLKSLSNENMVAFLDCNGTVTKWLDEYLSSVLWKKGKCRQTTNLQSH